MVVPRNQRKEEKELKSVVKKEAPKREEREEKNKLNMNYHNNPLNKNIKHTIVAYII